MEHHGEGSISSNTDYMRMKRSKRHTPRQIQRLEALFKDCSHPCEQHKLQLSRELALSPRQIDVWFQNKRAQMKTREERYDNPKLIEENDKIRSENITIREALENVICSTCGGPSINVDCDFDEQKLRIENAQLKEENFNG
ncbi:homeobox leucine zipper family protein [Medicago truncatula]|uniref:Homeobox leucine zipper family protein n=1 Tax=Medicago truncatula TaxID=3880 RepID=A0A072U7Y3_MEDTR|nr:homeobox leucine zipper family protein [Medicago truncatula]